MQRRWGILPNTLKLYKRAQCGPSQMNIAKPLTRATAVADRINHRRGFSSYYYRFPKIPRPKRNALYYSHWSNGGSPIKSIESTLSKFKNRSKNLRFSLQKRPFSNRFFVKRWSNKDGLKRRLSSVRNTKKPRGLRGKKLTRQLLALTSLCVVLFGIAASKITHTEHKTKEKEVKPTSWKLYAYSTLPLKAMSRLWGQFNSIDLPVWLRVPSFKLYSLAFGVKLDEIEETDLTKFKNLGEFFYRTIKPETRPVDMNSELVSPCDGRVLKFGIIENGEIEQVKGMTYSLDALLGTDSKAVAKRLAAPTHHVDFEHDIHDNEVMQRHEEFAQLNGISYTLDDLLGGESKNTHHLNAYKYKNEGDASIDNPSAAQVEKVSSDVGETSSEKDKQLFFAVIYLAPGDYHRFHSPTNWVATMRRHFIGELFSVAPYFQKTLQGLFVLNERVAMLGYWKYGFFSMTPVGATNVGSIKVNFDKDLSTNEVYEHSIYGDLEDDVSVISNQSTRSKKVVKNTCYEASYANASRVLGGQPLTKGQEVGGFKLGSTVVLVFEAPQDFEFNLKDGQPVMMGQSIGECASDALCDER